MKPVAYLDLDDLIAAARVAVGTTPEVRDWGLLEASLGRPRATVFGEDAYPTVHDKAAALVHSLVTNHGLVDGNKRLGLIALLLFYGMNGHDLTASEDDRVELIVDIASGSLTSVGDIAARLTPWVVPL